MRPPFDRLAHWPAVLAVVASVAAPAAQAPATLDERRAILQKTIETGEVAVRGGNPKVALDTFSSVMREAADVGDSRLLARALIGMGWAEWANGQYAKSLETRMRALDLVRTHDEPAREAYTLRGIGETLYALGRYDEALAQYQAGLDVGEGAGVGRERGLILSNIGSTYRNLGRLDEALRATERSVAMLRPLNEPRDIIQPLMVSGIVSRAQGDYDRSIAFYDEALATARSVKDRRWESQLLGNMGNVYLDLSRYDRAIELYRQSLVISDDIAYTAQSGFNHQNIASVLDKVSRPAEAMPHLEAALKVWRTTNRRPQIAATLLAIGIHRLRGERNADAARVALDEALTLAREIKEEDVQGQALLNLGDIEFELGRYDRALERYDAALAELHTPRNPEIEYQLFEGRGAALHRLGRLDEAIAALNASAAIVNDVRANVSSDESKIAFLDTRQEVFERLASALFDAGRVDEALEAAEAVRARALSDLMNDRNLSSRPEDAAPLAALRTAIAKSAPEQDVAAALAKLRVQNDELASLVAAVSPRAAEARAIAGRLNGATILEYLVTRESLIAFVVQQDAIRAERINVSFEALDDRVRSLIGRIRSPSKADLNQPALLEPSLRELHQLVVAPIARLLPKDPAKPVVIVPHGPLALLSFGALVDATGSPFVERHTLSYAPALSVLRYTGRTRPGSGTSRGALIAADPVPPRDSGLDRMAGSLREGRAVRQRLGPADSLLLSGATATEAAVKRSLAARRVVHLATHGLVSEQRPLASSLLFAEGEGDDGYLRADEIFGLRLDADLVVLSGCSTGLGRASAEGLLGLTRSFFFAGSRSIVVSYWDVSDVATVALMDRFYAGLARGMSKAAALRTAQIETRRRYPHPSLWAAFVLQGEVD